MLDNRPVDVGTPEEIVPAMVRDDHAAVLGADERRVKRASAKVKDQPVSPGLHLLITKGQRGRHRFLQQQRRAETGQFRRPFRRVALVQLEGRGHR